MFGTSAAEHTDEVFRAIPVAMYHKQLKNAIIAIETELGTDPAGSLTDLTTRLAVALDDDGTIKLSALNEHIGIADNNIVKIDDADAADDDYAKLTANGIEGRSYAEVKADLDLEIGTDVLAQQTIGIADDNLLEVDGSPNDDEYARFTANGLEGRTAGEAKTDLGFMTDLVDDTTPQLGGPLDANANEINNLVIVDFDSEPTTDSETNVDWTDGQNQKVTLTASRVLAFGTAPDGPCHVQLKVTQGGSGSYTITWPASVKWSLGITPTLSTGAGEIDRKSGVSSTQASLFSSAKPVRGPPGPSSRVSPALLRVTDSSIAVAYRPGG